ncbi:MAG TPA: group 1 truncated hemoglobin [Gemmatimonadaceae bacterium]|nr:group 1 truncated hemoglobin [Gemmatimonadaceae bacterium]
MLAKSTLATLSLAFVLGAVACTPRASSSTAAPVAAPNLYKRLGGYDALAAVTDEFLGRVKADTALAPFFLGIEKPALDRLRQMVVDQLCAATGGPCVYVGKTMKESHATLDITNAIFDRFVGHIRATLVRFAVPSREQNELLGALAGMRAEIVTK